MKRKYLLLILMTVMAMTVLTACGSDSATESGNTDQTTLSENTSNSQNVDEDSNDDDSNDSSTDSDNEANSESVETATPDKALVGEWKFSKIVSMNKEYVISYDSGIKFQDDGTCIESVWWVPRDEKFDGDSSDHQAYLDHMKDNGQATDTPALTFTIDETSKVEMDDGSYICKVKIHTSAVDSADGDVADAKSKGNYLPTKELIYDSKSDLLYTGDLLLNKMNTYLNNGTKIDRKMWRDSMLPMNTHTILERKLDLPLPFTPVIMLRVPSKSFISLLSSSFIPVFMPSIWSKSTFSISA